jgi:hypothetical protein
MFFWVFPRRQIVFADVSEPSVRSIFKGSMWNIPHPAFEDGPDRRLRHVGKTKSDAGEMPKRTYTIFKIRLKFEIKNAVSCDTYPYFH